MQNKWQQFYQDFIALTRFVCQQFLKDNCIYRASALTFTTLLSIVPLMAVGFTILAAFPAFKEMGDKVQKFVFSNFVATSGETLLTNLQSFAHQASRMSMLGFIFLIITAVLLLFTIERALNAIWQVKRRRKLISAFILYWSMLTLIPILIGVSLVISSYLGSLPLLGSYFNGIQNLHHPYYKVFAIALSFVAFSILYIIVPNCQVKLRYGFAAAAFATIAFEIAKWLFGLYIKNFSTYAILYGALATIPVFLLWLYLAWTIILFGAEISYALSIAYVIRPGIKLDPFTHAFRWLGYLWQAQQDGEALSMQHLIMNDKENYELPPRAILEELQNRHFIETTKGDTFVLTRDCNHVSLFELYQSLPWPLPREILDKRLDSVLNSVNNNLSTIAKTSLAELYQHDFATTN